MYSKCICFVLVWCPCVAINVSVQHNSGFLPDTVVLYGHTYSKSMDQPGKVASSARDQLNRTMNIYTVDPMLLPWGNLFKCHEEVLYLQPMIPPKRFDISPPDWGMLRKV